MKLTVLGKYGPYPQGENTACSGYLIEDGNTKILVDCGPGVLSRLQSFIDIKTLDAIYLTHLHYDHTSDLLPLRYYLDDLNHDINIITHITDTPYADILLNHKHFILTHIDETSIINIGSLNLTFYKMGHPVVNHGILIKGTKNLGITGDTVYCKNVLKLANESDYLLADCSKPIGFTGPHMSADYAFKIIKKTNTTILATHATPFQNTNNLFDNNSQIIPVEELKTYTL